MKTKLVLSGLVTFGMLVSNATIAMPTYSFADLGVLGGISGLNDVGQVIGYRYDAGNNSEHGFVYGNGGVIDLGATIRPTSINSSGQMSGTTPSNSGWGAQGFFSNGAGSGWVNLGGLSGFGKTEASMINETGKILGFSYNTGAYLPHAFVSTGTSLVNLGSLGGPSAMGHDINRSGVVAGSASASSGRLHAFISDMDGMHDLGTLGGSFSSANALNESGKIAGLIVPEPGNSALILIGLFCMYLACRRSGVDNA